MENVIVLDFGGQYNQLIARRVREFNVYCELLPYTTPLDKILEKKPIGIIFTGGPASVFEENAPTVEKAMLEAGIPVLGICYGCQLMAHLSGGKVGVGPREYGKQIMTVKASPLFKDIPVESQCWMSHTCYVEEVPTGFAVTATTATCPVAAMANPEKKLYGVQFHPEVMHTTFGSAVLKNFLYEICGAKGEWTMANFAETTIAKLKAKSATRKCCARCRAAWIPQSPQRSFTRLAPISCVSLSTTGF